MLMKRTVTITLILFFLFISPQAFALNKKKLHVNYFEELFQKRVQQFMKLEFSVKKEHKSDKKLLLKRLKELMDKEAQTI